MSFESLIQSAFQQMDKQKAATRHRLGWTGADQREGTQVVSWSDESHTTDDPSDVADTTAPRATDPAQGRGMEQSVPTGENPAEEFRRLMNDTLNQ